MLYDNYTEDLLGLKGTTLIKIEEIKNVKHIYLETKLESKICPHCYFPTQKIHSYRMQAIKDTEIGGLQSILHIKKRRYRCNSCGHTFYEKLPFLKRYQRHTLRVMVKVINDYRHESSTKRIAEMNYLTPGITMRIFDRISYPRPKLPRVLSIDEFKGNAGRKFQCILTDPVSHNVLDILPTKKSEDIRAYFGKYSIKERRSVKYLVMDMSQQFREIILSCFPDAKIVTDKFHVCRYGVWAMEKIRKDIQKGLRPEDRKWFKRSRWIMISHSRNLSEEDVNQLTIMLSYSERLRNAYCVKEAFFRFMESQDLEEAKDKLRYLQLIVHVTNLPEFTSLYEMIKRWEPYILRAFSSGYTNGYTEGCNNKIKVLKRNCYGVKNFERFRNRILHMMSA